MTKKLNGTLVSNILYEELKQYLSTKKTLPQIVDISIDDDLASNLYVKRKEKTITQKTNIKFSHMNLKNITKEHLLEKIDTLNKDKEVTGIMIQLPLPSYLQKSEREILDKIDSKKDIDGLTTNQIGNLTVNNDSLISCTAQGIITLLKAYDISLEGKTVAIINRNNRIGLPLANLLLQNNATPIITHSKTKNLKTITKTCDMVIVALNKQEFIKKDYIKEAAIVIDVGVHKNKEGKTVGDVDFDEVSQITSYITPPTGSIGPMTICMLAYNATKAIYGKEIDNLLEQAIKKVKQAIRDL